MSFKPKMKSALKIMISYWSWWWEVNNEIDALARAILTISVPLFTLLWYRWTVWFTKKGTYRLPPGPYGLPVLGYLPFLGSNLHEWFAKMAQRYGPIFSLRLGSKLHVVVNSMELAKVVARELDQTFANRSPPITALTITYGGLDIVWSNNNAYWRNMRKLLVSQVLSNANLDACKSFRTDEVRATISSVYAKLGTAVDINEIVFDTELKVVTKMLWGCSDFSDCFHGFREVEFKIIELLGAPNISDFIPRLSVFDLQGRRREMQRQKEHFDRILDSIIEERIKTYSRRINSTVEEDGKKDFLQIMLELKEQKDDATSFDIVHIKALLIDILIATTDTTSTMVEWVMAEILCIPFVKTKIQEELNEVVGMNDIVEESHLPRLKYLDAVVKETFRLHPTLPLLIQRCPEESCIVGGYTIPKGTIVYINVWAIQHDPKNWTDPLEFRPERFLNGKWDYNGNNFKFLPFGSGRRMCPGLPLGEKMLMYILASLLHSFEWNLPKDEEFELSDVFGFVTKKRKPLVAIPSQRLPDATLYK